MVLGFDFELNPSVAKTKLQHETWGFIHRKRVGMTSQSWHQIGLDQKLGISVFRKIAISNSG